ncbi:DUF1194 domain-containing protein [Methylobacterium brachythecii]|uniref:tRNA delta(2)-isopentenylpyrophosphate transferase n=1 Tax=Methylobacterium brachythecii TaxID=1176177 RepID=A0A7W6AIK6_9HYPH|nr:DUF1194 domain-containing protein [Methylobacterium brachythecii]MBB3903086.1 hypothetical protein [Methylobacterium brachythecii]GLS46703.1 hypothetical protein GCM10007884_46970 [Methylobacterium brachythecii]
MRFGLGGLAGALLCASAFVAPVRAADSVATALVVSVDVSNSVDERRYKLQMEGIAEALEDPAVIAAITGNPGGIYFSMVTWADTARVAVEWRRIASKADAAAAAALVRIVPRMQGNFTCLGGMMRTVAASVVPSLPIQADRTVVDVSGDGIDNCMDPEDLRDQRERLLATGSTINGLPILVPGENDVVGVGAFRAPGYGLRELPKGTYREGTTLDRWYRENVVGGPGAFLMAAHGYGDFARALRQKFVLEISGLPAEKAGSAVASR